jgi:hypothetical protein
VLEGVFMRLGEIGDDFAVVPEQFVADGETVVAETFRWTVWACGGTLGAERRAVSR